MRELDNHTQDAADEGTIWFDDTGAEHKVIQMLEKLADDDYLHKDSQDGQVDASRVLDLGTGNGHMLFALRDEEWQGELVGVDYSMASVQLAQQIAAQRQTAQPQDDDEAAECTDNESADISEAPAFFQWDLLHEHPGDWAQQNFDLVLDKGTYDAISLSADTDGEGRRISERYRDRIILLIESGGFLVITSCNWTKEELLSYFVRPDKQLEYFDEAKYPTFTFGGQKGQSVCTLAFQKPK